MGGGDEGPTLGASLLPAPFSFYLSNFLFPCFGPQAGNPGVAPEAVYYSRTGVGLGLRQ